MLDPIRSCDSLALGYLAGCPGYHSVGSMERGVRDLGLAIAAKVDCFGWNFHPKVQMVPEHVEHCSLSAMHKLEKDQYRHE